VADGEGEEVEVQGDDQLEGLRRMVGVSAPQARDSELVEMSERTKAMWELSGDRESLVDGKQLGQGHDRGREIDLGGGKVEEAIVDEFALKRGDELAIAAFTVSQRDQKF
jgi:hypothetical protein